MSRGAATSFTLLRLTRPTYCTTLNGKGKEKAITNSGVGAGKGRWTAKAKGLHCQSYLHHLSPLLRL